MFYSAVLFSISFCVYRACFTHLFFRQIELQSIIYGTMINCSTVNYKENNARVYRHTLWEYSKRFHCLFE